MRGADSFLWAVAVLGTVWVGAGCAQVLSLPSDTSDGDGGDTAAAGDSRESFGCDAQHPCLPEEVCHAGVCVAIPPGHFDCGGFRCFNGACLPSLTDCNDELLFETVQECEAVCGPHICSPENPCPTGHDCINGECWPAHCSSAHPTGVCPDGQFCQDGLCERVCLDAIICGSDGQLYADSCDFEDNAPPGTTEMPYEFCELVAGCNYEGNHYVAGQSFVIGMDSDCCTECFCNFGGSVDCNDDCFPCGPTPSNAQILCESTGGLWDEWSCGHYWCGQHPDTLCVDPGCDCGPGRNFVGGVGCEYDSTCASTFATYEAWQTFCSSTPTCPEELCFVGCGPESPNCGLDCECYEWCYPNCVFPSCTVPFCADGIKNGDETGIDCGGSCPPCVDPCDSPCPENFYPWATCTYPWNETTDPRCLTDMWGHGDDFGHSYCVGNQLWVHPSCAVYFYEDQELTQICPGPENYNDRCVCTCSNACADSGWGGWGGTATCQ